jgi:ribosome modulation factor
MNCYAEGYNAFTVGIKLTDNPYTELQKRADWSKGWLSAKISVPLTVQDCV